MTNKLSSQSIDQNCTDMILANEHIYNSVNLLAPTTNSFEISRCTFESSSLLNDMLIRLLNSSLTEKISIRHCNVNADTIAQLISGTVATFLLKNSKLGILDVSFSHFHDAKPFRYLTTLLGLLPFVHTLCLDGNKMQSEWLKIIGMLI